MSFQVFIVPSGEVNADLERTEQSFLGLPNRVCEISDWVRMNCLKADYKWFAVFYDNESIDLELKGSIISFLASVSILEQFRYVSCVIMHKRIAGGHLKEVTRLFHRSLFIGSNYCPICKQGFIGTEVIYGGFIVEHGFCP